MIMAARAPSSMRRRAYSALAYSTAQRRLRTGLTHFFKRRDEADQNGVMITLSRSCFLFCIVLH